MEQIRCNTIHCAVQLGDTLEGQGEVICPLVELGGNGERGWGEPPGPGCEWGRTTSP